MDYNAFFCLNSKALVKYRSVIVNLITELAECALVTNASPVTQSIYTCSYVGVIVPTRSLSGSKCMAHNSAVCHMVQLVKAMPYNNISLFVPHGVSLRFIRLLSHRSFHYEFIQFDHRTGSILVQNSNRMLSLQFCYGNHNLHSVCTVCTVNNDRMNYNAVFCFNGEAVIKHGIIIVDLITELAECALVTNTAPVTQSIYTCSYVGVIVPTGSLTGNKCIAHDGAVCHMVQLIEAMPYNNVRLFVPHRDIFRIILIPTGFSHNHRELIQFYNITCATLIEGTNNMFTGQTFQRNLNVQSGCAISLKYDNGMNNNAFLCLDRKLIVKYNFLVINLVTKLTKLAYVSNTPPVFQEFNRGFYIDYAIPFVGFTGSELILNFSTADNMIQLIKAMPNNDILVLIPIGVFKNACCVILSVLRGLEIANVFDVKIIAFSTCIREKV